jgi:hypothetical protein
MLVTPINKNNIPKITEVFSKLNLEHCKTVNVSDSYVFESLLYEIESEGIFVMAQPKGQGYIVECDL